MTQEEKDISVALFDKEVESFCKETFIKDEETKGLIFCCARHFTDWQKQQTIDKAGKWILDNFKCSGYSMPLHYKGVCYFPKNIAKDFKKAMKEEQR